MERTLYGSYKIIREKISSRFFSPFLKLKVEFPLKTTNVESLQRTKLHQYLN